MMIKEYKLILASNSPQRLKLLNIVGIVPDLVIASNIDEKQHSKEKPLQYVSRIAKEKAEYIFDQYSDSYVIAADTVITVGTRILGKPETKARALEFLNLLSGRKHRVLTSFCVISPQGKITTKVIKTIVEVKNLSLQEKQWYIDTGEWQNKSGGYAIQGKFDMFVKQINGSVSNVIGLPMMFVYNTLIGMGYKFNYTHE